MRASGALQQKPLEQEENGQMHRRRGGRLKAKRESGTVPWSRQEQGTSSASRSWQFQILACPKWSIAINGLQSSQIVQIPQKPPVARGGAFTTLSALTQSRRPNPQPPLSVSGHHPPGTAADTAAGKAAGLYSAVALPSRRNHGRPNLAWHGVDA